MTDENVWNTEPRFGNPIGPWFEWFAWHPVRTTDRGWRWLRPVWRRRWQTKRHLDGPTLQWFTEQVARPVLPPGSTGARMYAIKTPDGRLITDPEWLCPADVMRSSHGHGVTQMPGELVEIED